MAYIKETQKDKNYVFSLERNVKAYMLYTIIILGVVSICLAIALAGLMPLKQTKPYLLFFADGETNFVKINEANMDMRADVALLKSILAGYVKNRELINRVNDKERYEIIRVQSKRQVWNAFQNLIAQQGSVYTTPNIYRDIKIINVAVLSDKVATIDFYATIYDEERTLNTSTSTKYRASLEYEFAEDTQTYNSSLENPTGFRINKYMITEIVDKESETKK